MILKYRIRLELAITEIFGEEFSCPKRFGSLSFYVVETMGNEIIIGMPTLMREMYEIFTTIISNARKYLTQNNLLNYASALDVYRANMLSTWPVEFGTSNGYLDSTVCIR
jgi:hypothetical protein